MTFPKTGPIPGTDHQSLHAEQLSAPEIPLAGRSAVWCEAD